MRGLGHGCGNPNPNFSCILAVVRCWASFLIPLNLTFLKWSQQSIYRVKKDPGPGVWDKGRGQAGPVTSWLRRLPGSQSGVHSGKTRAPSRAATARGPCPGEHSQATHPGLKEPSSERGISLAPTILKAEFSSQGVAREDIPWLDSRSGDEFPGPPLSPSVGEGGDEQNPERQLTDLRPLAQDFCPIGYGGVSREGGSEKEVTGVLP